MALLTSCPFAIDVTTEYPILLQNLSYHGIGSRLKTVDFMGFRDSAYGFLNHVENCQVRLSFCADKMMSRCKKGRSGRIAGLRAARKDFLDGEEDKVSDAALQATIEKSKKVLAIQRELLQQIAERRKLVSSIRSSIMNPMEGEFFMESVCASNLDAGSNTGETVGDLDTGGHLSGEVVSSLPAKEPEKPSLGLVAHSGEPERKSIKSSSIEKRSSDTDSSRAMQLKDVKEKTSSSFDEHSSEWGKKSLKGSSIVKASLNLKNTKATEEKAMVSGKPPIECSSSLDISKSIQKKSSLQEKVTSVLNPHEKAEMMTSLPAYLSKSFKVPSTVAEKVKNGEEPISKQLIYDSGYPTHEDANPSPLAGTNVMNVVLVAAECAPWSKTGGLGDVAGSLPKALARRGHRVMVVAPRYGKYAEPEDTGVRKRYKVDGQDMEVLYYQAYIDGVDFVFIDSPVFRNIEKNIYGGNRQDILKRMILFCKVAVEVPWYVPCGGVVYGDGNLVFIANDWHTALLPVYLKAYYRDHGLMNYTRSVLVIHNIAHQGRGPVDDFRCTDLPEHYLDLFRMYDPVGGEHFNIFAAGLKAADRIVTVSHGYAWELKTPEGGWGLHGIINENDWKFRGIVNGIDTKDWNPLFDVHLLSDGYTNYSLETLQAGKSQCKTALQRELNLPVRDDVPLIGFIGRLDGQKGVDIIAEAVPWIVSQDAQLVMLGTGRPDLEQMLRQFESQYHDKVRGWVGFSVQTAHRITAGADILLMPSRFEPCGLNQLYAMSYGTIPVVHAVGGLRDTVQPFDPFNESGLGWTFDRAESGKLIHALGNCLLTYRDYRKSWEGLQRRGMSQDLSWDHAAEIYEEVLVAAKYQW